MVDEPAPKKRGRPRKPEAEKVPRESKPMGRPPKEGEAMRDRIDLRLAPSVVEAIDRVVAARLLARTGGGPAITRTDVVREIIEDWLAARR
jgi:hypothetical protein